MGKGPLPQECGVRPGPQKFLGSVTPEEGASWSQAKGQHVERPGQIGGSQPTRQEVPAPSATQVQGTGTRLDTQACWESVCYSLSIPLKQVSLITTDSLKAESAFCPG